MPSPSDKISLKSISKIAGVNLDRRVKLSESDKILMRDFRKSGHSYNETAREFGVCKKTAMNVCNPEKYEKQLNDYRESEHWKKYYTKGTRKIYMRNHREYKKSKLEEFNG